MMKVKALVAQSCPTLSGPMDCGPPGSSVHGIFQARVREWGAIAFSVSRVLVTIKKKFQCGKLSKIYYCVKSHVYSMVLLG